jgi:NAD(P)H dehydrogenase (quinone)
MNIFIVYAHPEPKSFNGAMKDNAVETLQNAGHQVVVSDLYAMQFNAIVGVDDFKGERANADFLSIATEQNKAYDTGTLATDIVAEQEKFQRADLVIFQFPVWWFGMPATPDGIDGDILTVLWPLHSGLLRYSGFDVLPPFVAYMPGRVGQTGREAYLEAYGKRLLDPDKTPRLFFHSAEDYGPNERLKPGVLARSGVQHNV